MCTEAEKHAKKKVVIYTKQVEGRKAGWFYLNVLKRNMEV